MGAILFMPVPTPMALDKELGLYSKAIEEKQKGKARKIKEKTVIPASAKRPRWARVIKTAGINTTGTQTVVPGISDQYTYIAMITFTVNDEGDVTLYAGGQAITGPMSFGGTDEPRGIVVDHSRTPIVLEPGINFRIKIAPAAGKTPTIAGYVTYYTLPAPTEE